MTKIFAIIFAAFGVAATLVAIALLESHPSQGTLRPLWSEIAWPFPIDQWGKGKAFRCRPADCGTEVDLYLRAKIGFCNCTTGVSDDAELDRMSDFDLVGEASPLGAGREISVGRMKGRSRIYQLRNPTRRSAISVAFSDRCDMVVATVVVPHDRPAAIEPEIINFLNSARVLQWAEITLGI